MVSTLQTDMVVMAAGIKTESLLSAETSGIEVNRGIIVNDFMETSVPRIYAVGECVEHRGQTYGLVAPLYDQATRLRSMYVIWPRRLMKDLYYRHS